MNTQLDKVLNELKNLSSEVYPNIELPTDTVLASYEREIGFIFPEDYKKVLKEGKRPLNPTFSNSLIPR